MYEIHELVYLYDVSEFGEYWDSYYLFKAYKAYFDGDIPLAASMVLWTLSIREFAEWDTKIQ